MHLRIAGKNLFSKINFAVFGVVFAALGAYFIINSLAATPTTANLWIDNTGTGTHNCQRVDSPETYSSAQSNNRACTSIQQAAAACNGAKADTIGMVYSANYGSQSSNTAINSPGCTVIAEASTTASSLSLSGSRLEVQNLVATGNSSLSGSNNTWRNVELSGTGAWMTFSGTDNKWMGGSLHGGHAQYGSGFDEPIDLFGATNAVIDGVEFYGITRTPDPDVDKNPHLEIIRIDRGSMNTTIKNSYFHDNDENTGTIFMTALAGYPVSSGLTLLNNRFADNPTGSTNLAVNDLMPCNTILIAYNTFLGGTNGVACSSSSNVRWIGNLGAHAMFNCVGSFSYNVWEDQAGTPCGATDTLVVGTRYKHELLGLGGPDGFHLLAGSPAINKAETPSATSICAPTGGAGPTSVTADAYGGSRPYPTGGRCDAGAHEYGSTPAGGGGDTVSPTVSLTAPSAGTVSGSLTVSANASDNVGVVGVQFKLDGVNIGSEDTTSPYSISWDSTGASNGSHNLTAVARDIAGNSTTSVAVIVNVSNTGGSGASLYISPTGSDTNACSQSAPCKTINGAYAKASAGTTIIITAGTYTTSTDSIAYRSALTTGSPVVVKPESGATVTFNDINMQAGNITFQGPNFNARSFDIGNYSGTRITNVTLDGLNIDAKDTLNLTGMNIGNVTGLVLKNSRVGNTMAGSGSSDTAKSVEFCGASSTCYAADVTFDHNTFYDADAPTGSLAHLECIFATGVQSFTVKNNRFQDCTYFDIFITVILANNQAQPKDYIIEDNLLGRTVSVGGTEGGYAINIHADVVPNNIQYLRNTIEGALSTGANPNGTIQAGKWQIIGTIISEGVWLSDSGAQQCRPGITFDYNVMPNSNCDANTGTTTHTTGATTSAIKAGWVAQKGPYAGDDDFHLKSTSPAINKGRPADAGTFDFDGLVRGSPPDAGAYELASGTTVKPGDTNNDGLVNIVDLSTLLSHWNTNFAAADFNADSTVNIFDLSILLSNYGK